MSLILEALKKSETRRRLGEAPDIGTPFTVKPRRRNPWPLIVISIVVAGGIGWWYAGTLHPTNANAVVELPAPPAAPKKSLGANAQQSVTPVAKAGTAPAAREPTLIQAQPRTDGSAPGPAAKPLARADAGAAGVTAPGGVDAQAMRPMNRHLALPAAAAPAPATANPNTVNVPAAAAQPPVSRATPPAAPVPAAPAARPSAEAAVAPPAQQPNAAPAQPEAAPAKPAVAPPPPATAAPAVPQYYELAYAVRKDIPQFNLSMHVFAPDPAARFIVVDGERKVEGDAVKEGLVLREVRTDGIILEFRGQRFFYPRPGH
jgi:general secretion pathway protein B